MATFLDKDAERFARSLHSGEYMDKVVSNISSFLLPYGKDKDKLYLLHLVRNRKKIDLENHNRSCTSKGDCSHERGLERILYAIDQEIESVNKSYSPEVPDEDEISFEERASIHAKLDEILRTVSTTSMKQDIVFEELDSLRERFELGKKNWSQLLIGKLWKLSADKVLDATVATTIFNTLTASFNAGQFVLPTTN